ncbi:hypothetical protein StrepF001_37855 [Streptomyces sp. F001]|uniref:DUF7711 family protein n=1 Tax=Streptomyces sp. F001 TaxID=1510026 RepID=UPI00101E3BCC|nr:hypothetical protein [Streptomyces sp. F001]RZB14405.1 hypothetical protein StrepF001_37855 [Streptomyces sp. F001]
MRHTTAVRRLRTITDACHRARRLPGGGALLAVHAYGPILEGTGDIPVVHIALVVDLPAEELPWGVEPPECTALANLLDLGKAPVVRRWRPAAWPVWNHAIRRPLRIWSPAGPDTRALDALAAGQAGSLRLAAPQPTEEDEQRRVETAASLLHLRRVRDRYWDDGPWRRAHRGSGRFPEDSLWGAVDGYLELLDAAAEAPPHR